MKGSSGPRGRTAPEPGGAVDFGFAEVHGGVQAKDPAEERLVAVVLQTAAQTAGVSARAGAEQPHMTRRGDEAHDAERKEREQEKERKEERWSGQHDVWARQMMQ